jgi:hypothetical protein
MEKNVKDSELTIASLESHSRQIARKATGPRTAAGKERSKYNALKHGIFSKVALLRNEPRSEFESMLNGLRNDFQPVGTFEEILVQKLASLIWRYRRVMLAEVAEIQMGEAFLEWEEQERQDKEVREGPPDFAADGLGLMEKVANSRIRERCLALLNEVKDEFNRNGFDSATNEKLLTELYGNRDPLGLEFLNFYDMWKNTAECSDEERQQNKSSSVEQCKHNFLKSLQNEIARLSQYNKARPSSEIEWMRLDSLRHNVPDAPQLDRLLKRETSLERATDRTLTQLERLQRMRLGQSVTPPIKLDISAS